MTSVKVAVAVFVVATCIGLGMAVWASVQTTQDTAPAPQRDPAPIQAPQ